MNKDTKFLVRIEMEVSLTENDVSDILSAALEGGIGYWCCFDNTDEVYEQAPEDEALSETAARVLCNGGKLKLIDEGDGKTFEMDMEMFLGGIRRWVESGFDRYNAVSSAGFDTSEIDTEMADMIIQLALFGEVVYG